jgi:hypothetical protein
VFPDAKSAEDHETPARKVAIPVTFSDVATYKRIFKAALIGKPFRRNNKLFTGFVLGVCIIS